MKFNKKTWRQIHNSSHLVDYDFDNMICTVPLEYDSVDDIVDEHLGSPKNPCISDDLNDYLSSLIEKVPEEFNLSFHLNIKDYGEYKHKDLLNALRANIENRFYHYDGDRKKEKVLAVIFIVIGIVVLAISSVGTAFGLFGEEGVVGTDIIINLLDIASWVFVWEGGAILFLTYESDSAKFRDDYRRIHDISFNDAKGKVLSNLSGEDFYKKWHASNAKEQFPRNFILFSNAFILADLCITVVSSLSQLSSFSFEQTIFYAARLAIGFILTISCLQFFREKGSLQKFAFPMTILLIVLSVFDLILFYVYPEFFNIKLFVLDIILLLALIINVLCMRYLNKESVKIDTGKKHSK